MERVLAEVKEVFVPEVNPDDTISAFSRSDEVVFLFS